MHESLSSLATASLRGFIATLLMTLSSSCCRSQAPQPLPREGVATVNISFPSSVAVGQMIPMELVITNSSKSNVWLLDHGAVPSSTLTVVNKSKGGAVCKYSVPGNFYFGDNLQKGCSLSMLKPGDSQTWKFRLDTLFESFAPGEYELSYGTGGGVDNDRDPFNGTIGHFDVRLNDMPFTVLP